MTGEINLPWKLISLLSPLDSFAHNANQMWAAEEPKKKTKGRERRDAAQRMLPSRPPNVGWPWVGIGLFGFHLSARRRKKN